MWTKTVTSPPSERDESEATFANPSGNCASLHASISSKDRPDTTSTQLNATGGTVDNWPSARLAPTPVNVMDVCVDETETMSGRRCQWLLSPDFLFKTLPTAKPPSMTSNSGVMV